MRKCLLFLAIMVISTSAAFAVEQVKINFIQPQNAPYLVGQPEFSIDSERFTTVILNIKAKKSGTARLFWANNYDPQMNEPKSIMFSIDRSDNYKQYTFNLSSQNRYWIGYIGQLLIYPENGPANIEIGETQAVRSSLATDISSGWREFMTFEMPQARSVNFIYGPKIWGKSVNIYIYFLIIIFSAFVFIYAFFIKSNSKSPSFVSPKHIILTLLICWIALDGRIFVDQIRTISLDWNIFAGKSLEEKRALTTLGDFYGFLQFAKSNIPTGEAFDIIRPGNYYYIEKARYYLYPTYYKKDSKYTLVYDPNRSETEQIEKLRKQGAKTVATYKEGEYILIK